MGFGADHANESGVLDLSQLKTDADDNYQGASHLVNHPAVIKHGAGTTSEELASYIEAFADYSKSRIMGAGKDSYEKDGRQGFEDMPFDRLVLELVDEIADAQNYLALMSIKIMGMVGATG